MADQQEKQSVSEVKASVRSLHISPRKARQVADLLKRLPVEQALLQLQFQTKKAAGLIGKLIGSAVADAEHNFQVKRDRLFIKNLSVDEGRVALRYRPRAQGRAFPVRKRTSHINLVLGVSEKAIPENQTLAARQPKPESELPQPVLPPKDKDKVKEEKPLEQKRRPWYKFWARDGKGKMDTKGKVETRLDRRGNM